MQCSYCNKPIYVGHVCPYCKEYHCIEHQKPADHDCQTTKQAGLPPVNGDYTSKTPLKPHTVLNGIGSIQSKLFHLVFTIVITEEVLRLISYSFRSPYIESNMYVMALSMLITPYVSSSILFLLTCLVLLATQRFTRNQDAGHDYKNLLKETVALGVFVTIAIIAFVSIANRLIILLT